MLTTNPQNKLIQQAQRPINKPLPALDPKPAQPKAEQAKIGLHEPNYKLDNATLQQDANQQSIDRKKGFKSSLLAAHEQQTNNQHAGQDKIDQSQNALPRPDQPHSNLPNKQVQKAPAPEQPKLRRPAPQLPQVKPPKFKL